MIVKIKDIVIDAGTQARMSINPDTVTEYAERMVEGDKFPPVVLFHDGSNYFIGDGFHRVLAAERNTMDRIDAEINKGTREDALWYALGANRTNGQRMTRGDIRHAVEVALQTWPEKTIQMIADQVGTSKSTASRIQEELSHMGKVNIPPTRTGKDGKQYPTTYRTGAKEMEQEFLEGEQEEDMPTATNIQKRTKIYKTIAPSCGLQYARIAITKLNEIAPNDRERNEAIELVKGWINDQHVS